MDRSEASTAELVRLAAEQISRLVRDELQLARAEMSGKARRFGTGAGLFGAAGFVALYGLGALGNLKIKDGFRVIPYIDKDETLLGGLFGIHGYRFLLFFEEEGVNRTMSVPDLDDGPDYETQTLYPLLAVNFKIGKYLSPRLKFDYRH